MYHILKPRLIEMGIKIGRDKFFEYLRLEGLLIRPKRKYTKTTHSKHWMKKYPNLTKSLVLTRPEQLFVSDIT